MAGLRENATMAEVLHNAMTGFTVEREWLRDYEIRKRFSDSKRPVPLSHLTNWLDDLAVRGKIETKIEDGKVFYRLIEFTSDPPKRNQRKGPRMPKDSRLDLGSIDERMNTEIEREREESSAKIATLKGDESLTVQVEQSELDQLREENEKMKSAVGRFLDARNSAREFMTIWSDPRKLPELVQEVYMSHPDIQALKKKVGEEQAQRASRLIGHMALTYEIHPLMTGMIYAWEQDNKVLVEVGYRGYGEMLKRNVLDHETRKMTDEEREEHGLQKGDRGWLCFVHDWDRVERFTKRGQAAPAPHRGVGVWRQKNMRNKPDNIPASKSNDWVAEKNSIKDAARKSLSFAVTKTAQADAIDFVYSATDDVWVMPVEIADWLKIKDIVERFEIILSENGISEGEFNDFLGHNWRYTQLDPDAMKAKLDEYIAEREPVIESAFVEDDSNEADEIEPAPEDAQGDQTVVFNGETGEVIDAAQVTSFWLDDAQRKQFWASNTSAGRNAGDVAKLWRIPKKDADNYDAQSWVDATAHYANVGEAMVALRLAGKES